MYNNCQKLYMFNGNAIKQIRFPLPSLETRQIIVAEIEAEQALVDANRELIERFEKKIRDAVDRGWVENREAGIGGVKRGILLYRYNQRISE